MFQPLNAVYQRITALDAAPSGTMQHENRRVEIEDGILIINDKPVCQSIKFRGHIDNGMVAKPNNVQEVWNTE